MRKLMALLLSTALLFSVASVSMAATLEENVVFTLSGLGIIEPDTETEGTVTRAEFAHIIVGLLGMGNSAGAAASVNYYADVNPQSAYAGDIALLTQLGIMHGMGDNTFEPNGLVSYEQAVKVLVVCIGYDQVALSGGGWPNGYIAVATKNGMLKNVNTDYPLSKMDLYTMIYNTLDVKLLSEVIFKNGESTLEKSGETLREKIIAGSEYELYKGTGVISANSFTYTEAPIADLADDEVVIDSVIFKIGKTNAYDLLGHQVNYYARDLGGEYELISVQPVEHKESVEITAEDFGAKSGNTISYMNEIGKGAKLDLSSDVKVIYNGCRVLYPADNIYEIEDGTITFFDNDKQGGYELVLINEYVNAIAEKLEANQLWFASDAKYNGASSLYVDPENEAVKMYVTDADGNKIESFDGKRTVSIFRDADATRYRVVVSDAVMTGEVETMDDETVSINAAEYGVASTAAGKMKFGQNYTFYVDYMGKIAFAESEVKENYAYILDYGKNGALSGMQAKLLIPGTVDFGVEVNEEDVTDTSRIPFLVLENKDVIILNFAKNVKVGDEKCTQDELMKLLGDSGMRVISYDLNADGEITKIVPLSNYGGDLGRRLQYNVYDKVFGGFEYIKGFAIDNTTQVITVPNGIADDDDYFVKVNITVANNNVGYQVAGFDYDENTKKAKLLVAYADMDASQARDVSFTSSIASMVTKVNHIKDEETDTFEPVVEILKAGEKHTFDLVEEGPKNTALSKLKKGDLVSYITNKNDLLENALIIRSIPQLGEDLRYVSNSGGYTETFGTAGQIETDEVDSLNKILVTTLDVVSGGVTYSYNIPQTNKPPVYIYDRLNKSIEFGKITDIRPDGDRVYILERTSDSLVRAIVLVR